MLFLGDFVITVVLSFCCPSLGGRGFKDCTGPGFASLSVDLFASAEKPPTFDVPANAVTATIVLRNFEVSDVTWIRGTWSLMSGRCLFPVLLQQMTRTSS